MAHLQEFTEKWNQIPWEKRNELALAIQEDCRNIIADYESSQPGSIPEYHLLNAKYVLHLCRSDAIEDVERGELHPDWNEVHDWTLHFFKNDFYITKDVFTFPITMRVWLELTRPTTNIGKCWYCGDLEQTLHKDGMCFLCSLK